MTIRTKYTLRRPVVPAAAALAALLLVGCTSGHIGEDWQCPLAAGGSCDSVAAADPAVPDPAAGRRTAPGEPLWLLPREIGTDSAGDPLARGQASMETPLCATDCGFDPLAWLERLFGAETEDGGERPAEAEPAALPAEATQAEARPAADPAGDDPAGDDPAGDDLRTGEKVARIWIAPFVDANGIYREAAHVRVVLEPAGWRLR